MNPVSRNRAPFGLPLLSAVLLAAGLALPAPAPAQVEIATSPLATSATTTVKPNLMFVLDDSGSMDGDALPDSAYAFAGKYGYNSAQCNGNAYNPLITYDPAVNSTGAPLNATATTFSAAYRDGYDTAAGTVDLSTGFRGGSGSGNSGTSLTAGPAFYYRYTGSQLSNAQKNYFDTTSTFYRECNSNIGSTPGSTVFPTKVKLAIVPTTIITVSGPSSLPFASITVTASTNSVISSVKVNGAEILSAPTSTSNSASTIASRIAAAINLCTIPTTLGQCTPVTGIGYSATVSGSRVDIVGPVAAEGFTPVVTKTSGNATFATTAFPADVFTTVSSITVGGTELLSAPAGGFTKNLLAEAVRVNINANTGSSGYSATRVNNVVTVTGPSSASQLTPVIVIDPASGVGANTLVTEAFPESTPAQLQNFANWYSYYSNRMLMMKTGAGLAFKNVSDKYRVGFLTMNNNVSPGIVEANTFDTAQRTLFYSKLYGANPGNTTPLREALSKVGQYYAHKFGSITTYKATITVGGSGDTSVSGIVVGSTQIMSEGTDPSTITSSVARFISDKINAMQVTDYGAKVSGNVVTITGPASAAGSAPVVTKAGTMTFSTTTFTGSTTTGQLNGITPADPVEYSCQQNFTILSTDGYWNGATTYNLSGGTVGQADGAAPRPFNDGAQASDTYTNTYSRNTYGRTGSRGTCPTSPSGLQPETITPQTGSCTTTSAGASCTPSSWVSITTVPVSPQVCITSGQIPANSTPVLTGQVLVPGSVGGPSDTLSDVAMYYYQTDLRAPALGNCTGALGSSVCKNNVFTSASDNNVAQHMTTFTLGLGVRGRMVYSPSYLTDTTGDFVSVKLGSTATGGVCSWQSNDGNPCNWPTPVSGTETTVDDLWHAAVNGRGAYFSATDPNSLATGMANALVSISAKVGAAAAAATSTLNPVAGNNFAYVASYTTQKWTGNLEARAINTLNGVINENASWCLESIPAGACVAPASLVTDTGGDANALYCVTPSSSFCTGGELVGTDCRVPVASACTGSMPGRVTDLTDTRVILTSSGGTTPTLIDFDAAYAAANPGYFNAATLAGLSQWPPVSDTSTAANYFRANAVGANMLNYLRGQKGHEYSRPSVATIDQFYRAREAVMGDALESQPAFLGAPVFSYPYPGYQEFLAAQAGRAGSVYMGTNDGMLHAFNASTGAERWAYVPSMVIPDLWRLADTQYIDRHRNYVNGSPITTDICTANCANPVTGTPASDPVWKTIVVAGLNGGGRGYYALDITDPTTPALLWEFTTTAGIGKIQDNDLGYTFGQPVVTRKADGTWVVLLTSGYDNGTNGPYKSAGSFIPNSPAGSGQGYLYVLNATTGAIISKISTGVGTAGASSGLAKIAGFNIESAGNRASYVYGGDLLGNLWRFDINAGTAASLGSGNIGNGTAFKFATLFSNSAGTQPQPITTTPILGTVKGKRVVYIGTGKYLEVPDLSTNLIQTQYAIKDDDATSTLVNARNSLVQQFLINNPDGTNTRVGSATAGGTTTGANAVDLSINRGWFVDFPVSRERVNIDAKLVLGTLVVATIVPSSTACAPGGSGFLNFFDYRTGAAVNALTGLTSVKYDAPIVGINVLFIEGKPVVEVVTATNPTPEKDPNVQFAAAAAGFAGKRVLWRELVPQD